MFIIVCMGIDHPVLGLINHNVESKFRSILPIVCIILLTRIIVDYCELISGHSTLICSRHISFVAGDDIRFKVLCDIDVASVHVLVCDVVLSVIICMLLKPT